MGRGGSCPLHYYDAMQTKTDMGFTPYLPQLQVKVFQQERQNQCGKLHLNVAHFVNWVISVGVTKVRFRFHLVIFVPVYYLESYSYFQMGIRRRLCDSLNTFANMKFGVENYIFPIKFSRTIHFNVKSLQIFFTLSKFLCSHILFTQMNKILLQKTIFYTV